jgi:protein-disulfide isomerase
MAKKAQLPKQAAATTAGPSAKKAPSKKAKRRSSSVLLLAVIAAVILVAAGVIVLAARANQKPIEVTNRVGEGTGWGPADAAVQIVQYSDYGCTYCKQFAQSTGEQLRATYESTGKVRFEAKNFIIEGQNSANAANAAECAADQGKFWDYHDVLFQVQGTSANPFTKALLKQYATQLGLDTVKFDRCVDADQHLEKVYQDSSEGQAKGVNATPTFFINGQKIEGAQPFTVFQTAVEAAVAQPQSQ